MEPYALNFLRLKFVVIVVSDRVRYYDSVISYDNDPCFSLSFVVIEGGRYDNDDKGFFTSLS